MNWLDHIRTHTEALAALAERTAPEVDVPTCPGWTMADLVWHVVDVQTFWEHIITNRPTGPETYQEPDRPEDPALPATLRAACDRLLAALEIADTADPAWSWSHDPADHTVAFTHRRQAHEAFVHLADAIAAADAPLPSVDVGFAADGIDEIIGLNLSGLPEWAAAAPSDDRVRLLAPDEDRDWTLRFVSWNGTSPTTGNTYEDEWAVALSDGNPGAEIAAPAVELDLWLWGRRPEEVVTVTGDLELARRLRELAREATQ